MPGGIARPQFPTWATLSSTARIRGSRTKLRRYWYGSCPIALASWSTISSRGVVTSGL